MVSTVNQFSTVQTYNPVKKDTLSDGRYPSNNVKPSHSPKDTVEISNSGIEKSSNFHNVSKNIFGFEPRVKGQIGIDEIYEHGMEYLDEFNKKTNLLFKEKGIDTNSEIDLVSAYGSGEIKCSSDHPDKEKIEAIFKDDPDLQNEFNKITSMLHLVESAKQASAFQDAYRVNPKQAVMQYSYLFTTHLESTMKILDDHVTVEFERKQNV